MCVRVHVNVCGKNGKLVRIYLPAVVYEIAKRSVSIHHFRRSASLGLAFKGSVFHARNQLNAHSRSRTIPIPGACASLDRRAIEIADFAVEGAAKAPPGLENTIRIPIAGNTGPDREIAERDTHRAGAIRPIRESTGCHSRCQVSSGREKIK